MTFKLLTYNDVLFDLKDPKPEMVIIDDIAQALSMICRFSGHTHMHYSVAEHSIIMSYLVDEDIALEALLHDAAETYTSDIPSPVKNLIPQIRVLENEIMEKAIIPKFSLKKEAFSEIKKIDKQVYIEESKKIRAKYSLFYSNNLSKKIFMERFEKLKR